jgi:mannose-6-phosphate isomerase-like protein (cupin superfamily)
VERPGQPAEIVNDRPEHRVSLIVDAEELAVTESVYWPGEHGPAPHVHHHHADGFIIVEGELLFTFREGAETLRAPAGTFVLVPPDVVHSFENASTANTRFYNLHAPSCGFGEYLRGRNPGFDQHDPPADGGVDPVSVVVTRLGGEA